MVSDSEEATNSPKSCEGDQKRADESDFAAKENFAATLQSSNIGANGNAAEQQQREEVPIDSKDEMQDRQNGDHKTLYVESLPANIDRERLSSLFAHFGTVAHVELPYFPNSRQLKEYAFVELESEATFEKIIKSFEIFGGVLSTFDPSKLQSVKAHEKQISQIDQLKKTIKCEKQEEKEKDQEGCKLSSQSRKRHMDESVVVKLEPKEDVINKKRLMNDDESNEIGQNKTKSALKKLHGNEVTDASEDSNDSIIISLFDFKILPKLDWHRLHNGYLDQVEQEQKKLLQEENEANRYDPCYESLRLKIEEAKEDGEAEDGLTATAAGSPSTGNTDGDDNINEEVSQQQAVQLFAREPGVIVEVAFSEPCVNTEKFIAEIHQYASVLYVDIKEGALQAHLRLDSASASEELLQQLNCAEYKCKILSGEDESRYWKKIKSDQEMKLNQKVDATHDGNDSLSLSCTVP